jgi:hypothetical protein
MIWVQGGGRRNWGIYQKDWGNGIRVMEWDVCDK